MDDIILSIEEFYLMGNFFFSFASCVQVICCTEECSYDPEFYIFRTGFERWLDNEDLAWT